VPGRGHVRRGRRPEGRAIVLVVRAVMMVTVIADRGRSRGEVQDAARMATIATRRALGLRVAGAYHGASKQEGPR
jgi:hypothetical protein